MGTRTCLKAFAGSAPWPGTFCPGSLRLLSTALGSQPKHLIKMASPGPVHKIGGPHPTSSKHFSPTNTMLVATVSPPPERLLREQAPLTAPSPAWRRPPREPGHLPAPLCRALPHATGPLHHRHRNGGHVASPVRGSTHISASKHQRDWLIGSNTRNWGRRARRRGPMAGGGVPRLQHLVGKHGPSPGHINPPRLVCARSRSPLQRNGGHKAMCFLKPKATHMALQRGARGAARLAPSPTHQATSPSLLSFVRRALGRICTELQMARLSEGASEAMLSRSVPRRVGGKQRVEGASVRGSQWPCPAPLPHCPGEGGGRRGT